MAVIATTVLIAMGNCSVTRDDNMFNEWKQMQSIRM